MTATVLGFDTSLARTGWAILDWDTGTLVDCGTIVTASTIPFAARIAFIGDSVHDLCVKWQDSLCDVGIESGIHRGSGEVTRKLAAAWGVTLWSAWATLRINPQQVTPTALKRLATGKGHATKAEVTAAAVDRWGPAAADADIADACWVAEAVRQARGAGT